MSLRGRLLIAPATERPLVYYGRGPDGLETGLAGSQVMADIDQAGVINVAARLGGGELTRVTRDQVFEWDPAIIIAQQRSFYDALLRSTAWRGLIAVASKRVYLAPADPFGWIDDPPGVNRIIGLYWLTALFYPDQYQEDLRTNARDFYDKFYGIKLTDRQLEALVRPAEARAGETRRDRRAAARRRARAVSQHIAECAAGHGQAPGTRRGSRGSRARWVPRATPNKRLRRAAAYDSVARIKQRIPRCGVQHTTARPVGLSVRCKILSAGTANQASPINAS